MKSWDEAQRFKSLLIDWKDFNVDYGTSHHWLQTLSIDFSNSFQSTFAFTGVMFPNGVQGGATTERGSSFGIVGSLKSMTSMVKSPLQSSADDVVDSAAANEKALATLMDQYQVVVIVLVAYECWW